MRLSHCSLHDVLVMCLGVQYLSVGLSQKVAEALVPQGRVRQIDWTTDTLRPLNTLTRLLQPHLQLSQSVQLLTQLPLPRTACLEVQLQIQGGTGGLLSQGGTVRLLKVRHTHAIIYNTYKLTWSHRAGNS